MEMMTTLIRSLLPEDCGRRVKRGGASPHAPFFYEEEKEEEDALFYV